MLSSGHATAHKHITSQQLWLLQLAYMRLGLSIVNDGLGKGSWGPNHPVELLATDGFWERGSH